MSAGQELKLIRTVKLPTIIKEIASADFDVLLVASGKIEKANFFRGSELLRHAGESLEKTRSKNRSHQIRRRACSSEEARFPVPRAAAASFFIGLRWVPVQTRI